MQKKRQKITRERKNGNRQKHIRIFMKTSSILGQRDGGARIVKTFPLLD
jgi:hypothetical protein